MIEEQGHFILHRGGDAYSAEIEFRFPSTVTVEEFLGHVADFMRAAGYQIPSGSLAVAYDDEDALL